MAWHVQHYRGPRERRQPSVFIHWLRSSLGTRAKAARSLNARAMPHQRSRVCDPAGPRFGHPEERSDEGSGPYCGCASLTETRFLAALGMTANGPHTRLELPLVIPRSTATRDRSSLWMSCRNSDQIPRFARHDSERHALPSPKPPSPRHRRVTDPARPRWGHRQPRGDAPLSRSARPSADRSSPSPPRVARRAEPWTDPHTSGRAAGHRGPPGPRRQEPCT